MMVAESSVASDLTLDEPKSIDIVIFILWTATINGTTASISLGSSSARGTWLSIIY